VHPKVSVIIPVYNQERYVGECVESVLGQDYPNLEVIVVDDGSTDGTARILEGFDDRIHYIRQDNRGAAAALNVGLRAAAGALVGWLSADDLYLPGKIRAQVEKMMREPEVALVYTDWIMIDGEGRKLRTFRAACPPADEFARAMLKDNPVNGSSVLIRRECFETAGYFDETLRANVDGDMWFRLLRQGCRFGHIAQPLIKYRWHSSNLSHDYLLMQACKDRVALGVIETFSVEQLFGAAAQRGALRASVRPARPDPGRRFQFRRRQGCPR
jgi:teichuronic acid biosynthesis glycosyltransferase TuaG